MAVDDSILTRLFGEGEFRACLKAGPPSALVVFRNGTQTGDLDSAGTALFLARHPDFPVHSGSVRAPAETEPENFMRRLLERIRPRDNLRREQRRRNTMEGNRFPGDWRTGITVADEFDLAISGQLIPRNIVHSTGLAKIYFFYAGIGYHGSAFYGTLARELLTEKQNNYNNDAFSWTAGLPFVRYEMLFTASVLPYYFWLEDDIASVMDGKTGDGNLARAQRQWDSQYLNNIAHCIYTRIGHFRFDLMLDRYIYRQAIMRLSLERLPSIFGTWGISWIKAVDTWIPGVWLEFPSISKTLFSAGARQFPLTIEPFRIHFDYWDLDRYIFGCNVSVHVGYTTRARRGNRPDDP